MDKLRIAVCNAQVPFEYGGAEILAESLAARLRTAGHAVALVNIPYLHYDKDEILKGYLAWRLLNLREAEGQPIDRVICLKFPSFAVDHPHKITWLVQQFRQVYDLFGTPYGILSDSPDDTELRDTVMAIDRQTLGESERLLAISGNVAKRLAHWSQLSAEVLYPPPANEERYAHAAYGDYVLSVSRLDPLKRIDLLVRAMGLTRSGAQAWIVGRGKDLARLQQLAREVGAADKVVFKGYVPDDEMIGLYANALALYYAPVDEDYGLTTIEAMKSSKPVLTAGDSGGVLEFVEDGITGVVVNPADPHQLAERIDQLFYDRDLNARWGMNARARVASITWDATLHRLLEG
ncbi:MAG: glycosyltransferase family 4 protein [Chloroflexi bacterium]|nr:glycosyltransferase family 4 protein [Chloroflexota bacterium]